MAKKGKDEKKDIRCFCFCCKKKVIPKEGSICIDIYKNGRYALRGKCPENNCSLSKILSDETAKKLKCKYQDCPIDSDSCMGAAEAGGIFALFALLAGTLAFAVKSAKNC